MDGYHRGNALILPSFHLYVHNIVRLSSMPGGKPLVKQPERPIVTLTISGILSLLHSIIKTVKNKMNSQSTIF